MDGGVFKYSHNFQYQIDIKKYHGQGTWKIDQEGVLILDFNNNEKLEFTVEVLSKDKLRIEKRKQ